MIFIFVTGCSWNEPTLVDLNAGLPDDIYDQEAPSDLKINSIGTLTEGYIQNTESLLIVNGRLAALCKAHLVCETEESN